ncbi:hypothetical protein, conserved [Babesia bigemina]|uniref:C3H1-type domain-containing protein n=1 Tax=Babesia bigemina TaxID=5866 RepID=A0A061BLB3_BABBI|nr:hypothetical protein, conserved [Babesia bigemina]CDR71665.1 hypothetical protein, conserved [Babesia bigemina]|eukprot:XP_012770612.1 hypothetical protein, conserved [Babesia bigemina]
MGFLYQVLKDVQKNKNLVKYFYTLSEAIRKLKTAEGKAGLRGVVGTVSRGISYHVDGFTGHSDGLKKELEKLNNQHIEPFNNVIGELKTADVGKEFEVAGRLHLCIQAAQQFPEQMNRVEEKFSTLDENLKNKLKDDYNAIDINVNKFVASATNSELHALLTLAENKFDDLRNDITLTAGDAIVKAGELRKDCGKQIDEKIKFVEGKVQEAITALKSWIETAGGVVDEAIKIAEKVHKALDASKKADNTLGGEVMKIEVSNQFITSANEELGKTVARLQDCIEGAERFRAEAEKKAMEALEIVNGSTYGGDRRKEKIKSAARSLQSKTITLKKCYESARIAVQDAKNAALLTLNDLDSKIKDDLDALRGNIARSLKKHVRDAILTPIKGDVTKIVSGEVGGNNGMKLTEEAVKEYAKKFTHDKFGDKVLKGWVAGIIMEDAVVRNRLTSYVKENSSIFKGDVDSYLNGKDLTLHETMQKAIKKVLQADVIKNAMGGFTDGRDTVESDLQAMKDVCLKFATLLGEKVREIAQLRLLAEAIVQAIESRDGLHSPSAGFSQSDLKAASEYILQRLVSRANHAAADIDWLILETVGTEKPTSIVKELHTATKTAEALSGKILQGLLPGGGIGSFANQVEAIEEQVTTPFNDAHTRPTNVQSLMINYKGKAGIGNEGSGKAKLNDQIEDIFKKMEELKVTDFRKYSGDPSVTVDREIADLHSAVTTALDEFTDALKKLLKTEDLHDIPNEGVLDKLRCLGAKIGKDITDDRCLDGIKEKISGMQKSSLPKTSNITESIQSIRRQLQNLQSELKLTGGQRNDVINRLTDLRDNGIFGDQDVWEGTSAKGLKKIHTYVLDLNVTHLKNLRNHVDTILNEAEQQAVDYITKTQKEFEEKITAAEKAVRTKIQTKYLEKIDALYEMLKSTFATHNQNIITTITTDEDSGIKGLMKRMYWHSNMFSQIPRDNDLASMSFNLNKFLTPLMDYIKGQVSGDSALKSDVRSISLLSHTLLDDLYASKQFDHTFSRNLGNLTTKLTSFAPKQFQNTHHPELGDILKHGMTGFVTELQKQYISRYSMETFKDALTTTKDAKVTLTEYGRKCAKVCLSIVPMVTDSLSELKEKLDNEDGKWKKYNIYNKDASHHSLHRLFFSEHGYDPGLPVGSKHGELNHRTECDGGRILDHLNNQTYKLFVTSTKSHPALRSDSDDISVVEVEEGGRLSDLFSYLYDYFAVCHLGAPSKRHPCSVNEMLCWLTGLPHNGVYGKLKGHVKSLFEVADKIDPSIKKVVSIDASPHRITHDDVNIAIKEICETSYALLTTFVGTGDEATYYACEFPNNSLGLQYPSNPADCLDTLLDILRRIFPPLKFLFMQCGQPASENGWLKCLYGKNVASSKWPCKEHSKGKARCEPKCQPTCGPKCQPNCRPTSPLQSYLSDSLTGHLPHSVTSIGCRAECNTCPKGKPGMPCITPLGFRGFSGSTKTGSYLSAVIGEFLGIANIHTLFGLSPTTPKTLPEHFDFVSCLVRGWIDLSNSVGKSDVQYAFEASAESLSIQLYDKPNELTDALRDAYGSESSNHRSCEHHHLLHLTSFDTCKGSKKHCAPYISPLSRNAYTCLPFKNSNTYLSWAIYLPWTFWDLLNNLYNAFCSINCQDWGCRGCLRGDSCKKGEHGVVDKEKPSADCQCPSIVDCKGVAPTLYQYGFVFGEASTLNDSQSPKKCSDFCSQLKNVLNSQYFQKLFEECDNFLYYIRFPFMSLTLALWLLSFLYLLYIMVIRLDLLYIMVIRLDLLHIKSHLHSPSSHRIAAQSLLAAARVNKLNRVFYLQP